MGRTIDYSDERGSEMIFTNEARTEKYEGNVRREMMDRD